MAHACPVCDQTCYCGGDIDDTELEEGSAECTHCDDDLLGDGDEDEFYGMDEYDSEEEDDIGDHDA